jgi:hypothetical protein
LIHEVRPLEGTIVPHVHLKSEKGFASERLHLIEYVPREVNESKSASKQRNTWFDHDSAMRSNAFDENN